jgi:hypothetical protein
MFSLKHRAALLLLSTLLAGCSDSSKEPARQEFKMGEKAVVGPLTFSIIESNWKPELGEMLKKRFPEHRFLILRISVTNGGGKEVRLPSFTLENDKGASIAESPNGEGVEQWIGLLRTIAPAETMQGQIVFDAPLASYKLRVTDGGEIGQEKVAFIEVPLRMDADTLGVPAPVAPGR